MNDLSENIGFEGSFDDPLYTDVINEQTQPVYNSSINGTTLLLDNDLRLHNESIRLFFITIGIIIVLVCITLATILCIFVCLNRRRNVKRQEKKDHLLLPEQSEKIVSHKSSLKNSSAKNLNSTVSSSGRTNLPSSMPKSSSNIVNEKISTGSYYYDNYDDIPYIDESRPTSYIDITRV